MGRVIRVLQLLGLVLFVGQTTLAFAHYCETDHIFGNGHASHGHAEHSDFLSEEGRDHFRSHWDHDHPPKENEQLAIDCAIFAVAKLSGLAPAGADDTSPSHVLYARLALGRADSAPAEQMFGLTARGPPLQ